MPIITARLAFVAAMALLTGCSGQRVVNALTPSDDYRRHADIAYGERPRQRLDVYVPKAATDDAPVVVFFYGGRWSDGAKEGYKFVAQALTSRGYIAVVPDYRLYPQVRSPAFVEDAAKAVAWTRRHAVAYGGDRDSLFLMGHSAGAHIAALLALDEHYLNDVGASPEWLAGMIGLAGAYDFLPFDAADLKAMFGPPARYPASQPINYARGDAPALLLLHGLDDETVKPDNSRRLATAIRAAGGEVATRFYEGENHVSLIATLAAPLRFTGSVLDDIAAFVDQRVSLLSDDALR